MCLRNGVADSQIIQESFAELTDENKDEIMAATKNKVYDLPRKTIRPEFLNRIDEIIMFTPLTRDDVRHIVELQLRSVSNPEYSGRQNGITLRFTGSAIDWLAQLGYDPQFGARPLKRVIQKKVLNELSKQILAGSISKDDIIELSVNKKHEFVFGNVKESVLN